MKEYWALWGPLTGLGFKVSDEGVKHFAVDLSMYGVMGFGV